MNSEKRAIRRLRLLFGLTTFAALATTQPVFAGDDVLFSPDNLVVSRSVYDNKASNVTVGQVLPPNCTNSCVTAGYDGSYPAVWNNAPIDGSFGITSKIFLDQITRSGKRVNSIEVPNSAHPTTNQIVTSFSSKSEFGPESFAESQVPHVHGLRCADQCHRCFQFQYARRGRPHESGWRERLPRGSHNGSLRKVSRNGDQRVQRE